jgi:hypothetical protein
MPGHVNAEFGGLSVLAETERCPRCGRHIGRERATFAASDKPVSRFSLFATSDGFYVANKKFRDFANSHGFTGVEFVPLENGYFVLKVARQVAYDLSTAWVNQEDWCPECRTFRRNLTVPGSHPIAAYEAPIGPFEVVESHDRWGVEVGLRTAQKPNLIVGDVAWHAIDAARFRGVTMVEVGTVKRY